jgi:hypothetical protein
MTHRRFVLALLFTLLAVHLSADVVVRFVDGDVELTAQAADRYVDVGMTLTADDTVRLAPGGYLELDANGTIIKVTRPGTYRIASLLSARERSESSGTGSVLASRISRLLGRADEVPQTVAMGVRGPAGEEADVQALFDAGELIEAGDPAGARELLLAAYDGLESRANLPAVAYLLGVSSVLLDDTSAAIDWLELVGPDPRTPFFTDHAVLLAHLLSTTFAWEEALLVLDDLRAYAQESTSDPDASLLYAVALAETGEIEAARSELATLLDGPNGEVARDLLDEIADPTE